MRKLYRSLSHLPGFVLLESSDKMRGRYDIISAFPYHRVQFSMEEPLSEALIQHVQEQLSKEQLPLTLPFQGGAIGYVSYDFGERLMGISSAPQKNLADLPLVDLGLYDWAIITDHLLKKVTLFAAHRRSETAAIVADILTLWDKNSSKNDRFVLNENFQPVISKIEYKEAFDAIKKDIRRGRSYQVNYTQAFQASCEGDSWGMYERISRVNPVPYSAFLRLENSTVLSFSPERYLFMNDDQLLTSPIKGTARRSDNLLEDKDLSKKLAQCPKNRAENVMIVDLMRNDLGRIAKSGSVLVSALCEVQSFKKVHHLVSDIRAVCLKSISPMEAFFSCFPGGSVTGAPKLEAMKIINEQEPFSRGIYCGSIGYFSAHGRFDSNIAIRTIVEKNNIMHLSAGGGIVIDSDWEEEYQECLTKISAITALSK